MAMLQAEDFEKGEEIGHGTQGVVFKGVWKSQKRMPVAIKSLYHMNSERGLRLSHKVEALSKLRHPNIIFYYGTVTLDESYCIVTELAEKGSLWSFLRSNQVPDLPQSFCWATEIAAGIEYLHQQNCLHRNLKSSNVLLMEDLTAKICDYRSVKLPHNISTDQTGPTGMCQWKSPEAIQAEKASYSGDVYSYGVLLWELLTHKIPFEHLGLRIPGQEFILQQAIVGGERPPIPETCGPKLTAMLECCWKQAPEERPTISEILTELEEGMKVDHLQAEDFDKQGRIGRGSGGVVFKGEWRSRRKQVAMKKLVHIDTDVPGRKLFVREAIILSKLDHPNIIPCYGIVTLVDGYYIVMELAKQGSLWDHFRENPTPNLPQSLCWAKEVAAGVDYLYQQKCLHRDLKSGNVLLKGDLTARLCDFASAILTDDIFAGAVRTSRTGTFQWMPPEAIMGEKVSYSWDVYSYGILLWELLTHRIPFEHLNLDLPDEEFELQLKITEGQRPPIPDSCDPNFASLMQHCWKEKPEDRPFITEVLKELEQMPAPWVLGKITRPQAELLLMEHGSHREFLIRESPSEEDSYVLSMRYHHCCLHFKIVPTQEDGYAIPGRSVMFPTIDHIILHFQRNNITVQDGVGIALAQPIRTLAFLDRV